MKQINLPALLSRTDDVKAMINKVLKVKAGIQNVHHIIAVANGFKDKNTLDALSKRTYYTLRTNLGTKDNPFYITRDVGYFDMPTLAYFEAETLLRDCQQNSQWELTDDNNNHVAKLSAHASPRKGLSSYITTG